MYKLINNDAEIALKEMESCSIDNLISDIPYGVNINPKWDKGLPSLDIWQESYRVLKPGSHCIIFGQPSMCMDLMSIMSATDFEFRDIWIWQYQGTHTKGFKIEVDDKLFRSRIRNVFNPIYVFRKKLFKNEKENWNLYRNNLFNIDANREPYEGKHENILKKFKETGKKHFQSKTPSNTFKDMNRKGWVPDSRGREPVNLKYIPRATRKERTINGEIENNHETVKPIKLMLWLVNLTTFESKQSILDPFCGTGSTGCACMLLNRRFIGIDNDINSIKTAEYRINNIHKIKNNYSEYLI